MWTKHRPDSPTQQWSLPTDSLTTSFAFAADGTIYFGSEDNDLYALNPDGSQKWAFATQGSIGSSPPSARTAPSTSGRRIIISMPSTRTAAQKWAFLTGGIDSSPAIGTDGTIYVGSWDNNLYAVNPNGSQKWACLTGGSVNASPAIGADGTIYVGSQDDNLYAINAADGRQQWAFTTGSGIWTSPVVGANGTIYLAAEDGEFLCP